MTLFHRFGLGSFDQTQTAFPVVVLGIAGAEGEDGVGQPTALRRA